MALWVIARETLIIMRACLIIMRICTEKYSTERTWNMKFKIGDNYMTYLNFQLVLTSKLTSKINTKPLTGCLIPKYLLKTWTLKGFYLDPKRFWAKVDFFSQKIGGLGSKTVSIECIVLTYSCRTTLVFRGNTSDMKMWLFAIGNWKIYR